MKSLKEEFLKPIGVLLFIEYWPIGWGLMLLGAYVVWSSLTSSPPPQTGI